MIAFGVMILLYAGVTAINKSKKMLTWRTRNKAEMKDEKLYMSGVARILALVSLAPIVSGLLAFIIPTGAAAAVLIVLFVILLTVGVKSTEYTR